MKQIIVNSCIVLISAALTSANFAKAQDTVVVKPSPVVVVQDDRNNEDYPLYRGEFGVRYMPTFTSLEVQNVNGDRVQGSTTISHGFGIVLAHNFSSYTGVQAEINYDQIAQKYKDQGLDRKVTINYINVPLLLAINTDKTLPIFFGVVVGPQFGVNLGSKISGKSSSTTDTLHAELAVKQGDVGLAYGAGFGIALNPKRTVRLDLGFRGVYGFVDIRGTTTSENSYNVLVKGSRKSYGGYIGITFLF
jgi:hypothetical protein